MRVDINDEHMRLYDWWKNFYFDMKFYEISTIARINKNLKPYKARFVSRKDDRGLEWVNGGHLEFDTKEDYVMFVLRWS